MRELPQSWWWHRPKLLVALTIALAVTLGLVGLAGPQNARAARSHSLPAPQGISTPAHHRSATKLTPRGHANRRHRRVEKATATRRRAAGRHTTHRAAAPVHQAPVATPPTHTTGTSATPAPASPGTPTTGNGPTSTGRGAGTSGASPTRTGSTAGTSAPSPTGTGSAAGTPAPSPNTGTTDGSPADGAIDTSDPTQVIGDGQPASCTSAAVVSAVAAGGIITFDCGPNPLTITMEATAVVTKTSHLVVLDGGGLVTLSGAGVRQILFSDTCQGTWSTGDCVDQPYPQVVVQNITFEDGDSDAQQDMSCTQNTPTCWYGGVDGGGAIYVEGGQFEAIDSNFVDNRCFSDGPDLGGGAIRALAQYDNLPVDITDDTFTGNSCSNGGALSSIDVGWNILDSQFLDNSAIGWGANPAAAGTPGGGSGGAIYLDGANDDVQIDGTVMSGNTATEGGGAIFDTVDNGYGTLTFDGCQLNGNTSGVFQTAPGLYYLLDGQHTAPLLIDSTDN